MSAATDLEVILDVAGVLGFGTYSEASGFMVPGQLCRPGNLLQTKNFFLW